MYVPLEPQQDKRTAARNLLEEGYGWCTHVEEYTKEVERIAGIFVAMLREAELPQPHAA